MDNWDRNLNGASGGRCMGTVSGAAECWGVKSRHRNPPRPTRPRAELASKLFIADHPTIDDRRRRPAGGVPHAATGTESVQQLPEPESRGAGSGVGPSWSTPSANGTVELDDAAVGQRSRRRTGCDPCGFLTPDERRFRAGVREAGISRIRAGQVPEASQYRCGNMPFLYASDTPRPI